MRALLAGSVFAGLALVAACGSPPPAEAQPRKGAAAAPDAPLVTEPTDTDADLARAIRAHYTKYEYRIPMRDGARLFTSVYVPKDLTRRWPFLLTRTPYSVAPYGADAYPDEKNARSLHSFAPSTAFIRDGYIMVKQDVRGRLMSEGAFTDVRPHAPTHTAKTDVDESTDAYDTVDWLIKNVQPNNGNVGVWGISYPGFYAAWCAVDAHPAVKVVSPQAPVTEWFIGDDFHHNGAFFFSGAFDFYNSFGRARPEPTKRLKWENEHYDASDAYDFFLSVGPIANIDTRYFKGEIQFWKDAIAHPNRDGWWQARDPRPWYRDAKPAIMTVGGFYDAEDLWGTLETYHAFEKQNARSENVLVMGPWRHGGWMRTDGDRLGDITFGQKASADFRDQIELPFFRRYLKGVAGDGAWPAEATVFETGTNVWQRFKAWPPQEAKPATLFFHAGGKLSSAAVATSEDEAGADAYVSDPAKPVPYSVKPGIQIDEDYMTEDQRFAARRPDVLVYTSKELDADVTLAGPIAADLWVTTTGTDADFVVKVVDVHPGEATEDAARVKMSGYQELVRAEIMRGRFRSSFERPEPFKPGEPTRVKVVLPDVMHTFRSGHRLMVQVQSSWFPLADRNPQTYVESIYKATEADFKAQTHRVLRAKDHASSVQVTLLRGALP